MVIARTTTSPLLCVLYWYCVLGINGYEYFFKFPTSQSISHFNVTLGSDVTLVCPNRQNYRVTWYKYSMERYAAFIEYVDGSCVLNNKHYPSISLGRHRCTEGYSSITFSGIQYTDSGVWWCVIGTIEERSQYVNLTVIAGAATTHASALPTSSTERPRTTTSGNRPTNEQSSSRATLPGVITAAPSRTSTSTENEPRGYSSTTKPIKTSKSTKIPTSQSTSTGSPDIIGTETPLTTKSNGFLIPVLGGAIGGIALLALVIVIVTLTFRAREISHEGRRPSHGRTNGGPGGSVHEYHEVPDDIGREYVRLSNTMIGTSTCPNVTYKGNSACTYVDDEDALVVAENPIYTSYDQEEAAEQSPQTVTSVYDKVPDVYTMVQKVPKPPADQSRQDNTKDTKGQGSHPEEAGVYSLAKEPV